jgi:hypothetical protein
MPCDGHTKVLLLLLLEPEEEVEQAAGRLVHGLLALQVPME